MTRIILRCFLVLAFTGVLLSTAQEKTSSDASHSTPQSRETSSSAPESSSVSVGPPSSHSPVDKSEDESSSLPSAAATGSSNPDVTTSVVDDTPSKTTSGSVSENVDESTSKSSEDESHENDGKFQKTTLFPSDYHSEGLHKAELQDADSHMAEIPSERSSGKSVDGDSAKETSDEKGPNASDEIVSDASKGTVTGAPATSEIHTVSETVDGENETTTVAPHQSAEGNSSENATTNDSGQSSVPSKEETIYNSSYVDKNQTQKEMSSTSPSKVQTEENGTSDSSKSATRKRSLNATNTAIGSTTAAANSEQFSSSTLETALTNDTMTTSQTAEAKATGGIDGSSIDVLATTKQPVLVDTSSDVENAAVKDKSVTTTYDTTETEVTNFPHTINSAIPNADVSVAHFHESEHLAELASFHEDVRVPLISSAALSTLTEESIHPFESIGTTAQAPNVRRGISTASSNPQRSPELEVESAISTGHAYSLFTFDPDGVTHNFSQDPDSITFSPGVFHVDGMPTDGYLSRLEHEESLSHKPEIDSTRFTRGTTALPDVLGSSSQEAEGPYPFEREREVMSSPSHFALPHDEPDIEEMHNRDVAPSTIHPEVAKPSSTSGSLDVQAFGTSDSGKIILPVNDESEEMLNDSPHFVQIQSKPTVTPTVEVKNGHVSKDLELNFSNDITHSMSSGPQNTPETVHELDFSTEHHYTEQSEIRPVTAVSPLKPLESTTFLPVSIESHLRPAAGSSDTALPHDASSPINHLSNSAPTITNQSAETTITTTTTAAPQSDIVGNSNSSDSVTQREDDQTTSNTSSTIAGIAVKTSVSVSFPLSNTPNDTVNSTIVEAGNETSLSSNASDIILPLPIPINKDADGHPAPTEPPASTTKESIGLRIRKPKLKINGVDSDSPPTQRTRKPLIIRPFQKSTTTAGPPVSIFKKNRTRINSITSSTTARPLPQFSTIRIHYASRLPPGMVPGGELVISTEPVTTTVPTTTETEEPFSDEPFTEQTQGPILPSEDDVTLIRVAGYIVIEKGLRWDALLDNRHSPQYKEKANFVKVQLYRLFRTSPVATHLWNIKIDGFSVKKPRSVAIDFFLYLVRTPNEITMEQLTTVFHDKLKNNTFSRFTVDTNKTSFELLNYESIKPTTEPPEEEQEPVIPQWAIAVIVVGAASLIFIVLFAAVAILGRHHVRRRYSSKLNDEDSDRPTDWESKMAAAYENLAADTIYDAEDLPSDTYKKRYHNSTGSGRPSRPRRADSWSSSDWSPPPRRPRPQVHRIVY